MPLVQTDPLPKAPDEVVAAERPRAVRTVKAAVLFADLRGYTALAEQLAPAVVLSLLQQFFDVLLSVVGDHGGQVFHVAGDNLMAGFALHRQGQNGGSAALACGQVMVSRFAALSEEWHRELGIATSLGVGVHFGEVAVGLLGPPRREAWTLIGDTVNVAARLCDRARAGEVLFSAAVLANIRSTVREPGDPAWWECETGIGVVPLPYRHLSSLALRGRKAPVEIWCLPAATERVRI
jgi:class 3 adenylate cyclase